MTENSVLLSLKQRYMWGGAPIPATQCDAANSALELLRLNIQEPFSREVLGIVAKFREKYFLPAMKNIKENLGENSITDEQIHRVCVALLAGAKDFLEAMWTDDDEGSQGESSSGKALPRKRKEPDNDSPTPSKRPNLLPDTPQMSASRSQKLPKPDTGFVLESQACKVFDREKILTKHPELSHYQPDFQDREYLVTQKIIPSKSCPATLLLHDELLKLAETRTEYRSFVKTSDLQLFRLPEFILKKMIPAVSDATKKPKSSLSSSHATLSALLAKQTDPPAEDT
ncbi:deoxynucleotidyltransferase terminal-interacting protein 1 [Phlebotomus argentipes]|uniref:deoxynucleotidyltransferase terminal-interacting protein 1 n=1 Tax=Phlebotomus argentipes TaxID=94469 RepID=UPI002892E7C1|nr:deoxynucleotidyltransferase terminal-interacting protein 1 [Phlebotomus argentipes]